MEDHLIQLLFTAAESSHGVAIVTNDVRLLRNKLYATKKKFPDLPPMAIITPPVGGDSILWIVRKEHDHAET